METVESLFLPSEGGPCLAAVEEGTENASLVNPLYSVFCKFAIVPAV